MKSGPMRHLMSVVIPLRHADAYGGFSRRDDVNSDTVWASITPASPREIMDYKQLRQEITHVIRTRWRDDIVHGVKMIHDGVDYYVAGVSNPDMRKRELRIVAKQGAPDDFVR